VLAELHRRGLIGATAPIDPETELRRQRIDAADRQRRIDLARDMWRSAVPARATVVERYLRSRGIETLPPAIRFSGAHTPYGRHAPSGDRRPVMVAAVEHVEHGLVGVSRTFLAIDGSGKASLNPPRLFTGAVAGGAVRLAPVAETLVIGEGVETTLAAMQATALPGWAALSAIGIERLSLPPIVRNVVIAVDRDANGTGERAARAAAAAWLDEGRRVRLLIPHIVGADAADLIEARHERHRY
jgi:phage/plasmid primase-like uncharacterized protein